MPLSLSSSVFLASGLRAVEYCLLSVQCLTRPRQTYKTERGIQLRFASGSWGWMLSELKGYPSFTSTLIFQETPNGSMTMPYHDVNSDFSNGITTRPF